MVNVFRSRVTGRPVRVGTTPDRAVVRPCFWRRTPPLASVGNDVPRGRSKEDGPFL